MRAFNNTHIHTVTCAGTFHTIKRAEPPYDGVSVNVSQIQGVCGSSDNLHFPIALSTRFMSLCRFCLLLLLFFHFISLHGFCMFLPFVRGEQTFSRSLHGPRMLKCLCAFTVSYTKSHVKKAHTDSDRLQFQCTCIDIYP